MLARVRDTEIFFDVDGAGLVVEGGLRRERLTAFLVHGGPGTDHIGFKMRFAKLAEHMQLVYFDQRGHGLSARHDQIKYTLDENVEDMEALRLHLGLGPIVSIGGSYGGRVAMAHAARYPDAVSHLVLIATAAQPGSLARANEIVSQVGTPEQIALCDDMHAGRLDSPEKMRRFFEVLGPLYSRRYAPQSGVGLGPTILTPEPFNQAHGPGGFLWSLDLRAELPAITARALIVAGRHDWRSPPEFSEEMCRLIPRSELHIFEDSGHSIASDEPEKLLDVISDFLFSKVSG